MGFFSKDGPLDAVSACVCFFFSSLWFLAYGVGIRAVRNVVPKCLTVFGLLDTGGSGLKMGSGEGIAAIGGGAYALIDALNILYFFLGTESAAGRQHRQTLGLYGWFAFFLVLLKSALDGNNGGLKSTFSLAWIGVCGFMTYLHWTWVGGDVKHKLKLA